MPENDFRLQLTADLAQMERGLAKITNQLAGVVGGLQQMDGATKKTEQGAAAAGKSQERLGASLNQTRYALYDVSRTMVIAGAAMLAFAIAPSKVAIEFERQFANVARTVDGAGSDVKQALIDLSTDLPVSFKNLTEIATLGGQLGIAKSGIIDFTETVAKLTATTNLSAEVAGTALGRFLSFGLVTSDQFENLASSILKVGVNSVATESQIVGIATGVAGIGKVAGLSASTLVGYAGALASVGIQQYAARGTTQRFLTEIQKAASEGGPALDTFAKISGSSAADIKRAFGTSEFSPIFESLIQNLGDTSKTGKDLNSTLADLGINSVIDRRTLLQLSAAPETVKNAFRDAAIGIRDSSTLNEQYGKIAETTSAKITRLGNSIQAFLNSIGSSTAGPLGDLVDGLLNASKAITDFISTPFGQGVAIFVTAATLLSGIILILGGTVARGAASFIGLVTAMKGLQAATGTNIGLLATLNTELAATGTAGSIAARGITAVSFAAKTLGAVGIAAGIVVGASEAAGALDGMLDNVRGWSNDLQSLISRTSDKTKNLYDGLFPGKGSTLQSSNDLDDFTRGLDRFFANANFGTAGGRQIKLLDDALTDLARGGKVGALKSALQDLEMKSGLSFRDNGLMKNFPALAAALKETGISVRGTGDNMVVYAKQTEEAKKANENFATSLGTTTDFASQLTNATGLDEKSMGKYVEAYQKSVSTLTDFNSIVSQVQAGLQASADAQAAASDGAVQAKDIYDGQSVSLDQFTSQLQTNNTAQQTWASNLIQLSSEAGPQAAAPFIQAGYSAVSSSILQQLLNATPEQRDAYIAAQVEAANLASQATAATILASGYVVTSAGGQIGADTAKKMGDLLRIGVPIEQIMATLNLKLNANPLTPVVNTGPAQGTFDRFVAANTGRTLFVNIVGNESPSVANARATGNRAYASGGHVSGPGSGTSDSIPARLSNGEYVVRASVVRAMGVGFFNNLNQGRSTVPGRYAGGGPVESAGVGMGVTELGPKTLSVLRRALVSDMSVYLGNEQVARTANRGNAKLNGRGSR